MRLISSREERRDVIDTRFVRIGCDRRGFRVGVGIFSIRHAFQDGHLIATEFRVFAYKQLIPDPVFQCDRFWYLRVSDRNAVMLKHLSGAPIEYFAGSWFPVFVYTGLETIYLLALEADGMRATWLLSPDGRRLGDKITDLTSDQQELLRRAISSRGPATVDWLVGDGMQLIEPLLLRDILSLAAGSPGVPAASAAAPQKTMAMLGAPNGLRPFLRFRPGERNLLLQEGWNVEDGVCRATGSLSTAHGDVIPAAACHLLTISLLPTASDLEPIELGIEVNSRSVGEVRLDPEWQREGADLAFWLAPELINGKPIEIAFRHSGDFLLESLKIEQGQALVEEPLTPEELMLHFENIGDNCEFGLVQRHFKADPVGLLRFAGLRTPRRLIRFLEERFGRFGDPGTLGVRVIGGEYWITDDIYGISYHTFRYQREVAAEEVIRENEVKTTYLKRKFVEDLEDGDKIMVYKRVVTDDVHEIIALHAALNSFGTVNKLLWVTQADGQHVPGDVEWVGDRLLRGYVGTISLTNAHHYDADVWLRLCRNALASFSAASLRTR